MLQDRFSKKTTPQAIIAVVRLMNELIELMTAEPALVTGRKFEEHKTLLKRKQRLTLEYRATVKSLATQPELFRDLPEETRRTLKTVTLKLGETADRNARSLRAAVMAVQRLVQNIVAHIKSEKLTKPGYKNPNAAYLELGNYSPTCEPVAVRRTV